MSLYLNGASRIGDRWRIHLRDDEKEVYIEISFGSGVDKDRMYDNVNVNKLREKFNEALEDFVEAKEYFRRQLDEM